MGELSCPICNAEVPLSGDEHAGDEVFCTYCGAPSRLTADPKGDDCGLEEEEG